MKTPFGPKAFKYVDNDDESDSDDEKSLVEDMWGLSLQSGDDDEASSSDESDMSDFAGVVPDILDQEDSKINRKYCGICSRIKKEFLNKILKVFFFLL
mgnify:FL=1